MNTIKSFNILSTSTLSTLVLYLFAITASSTVCHAAKKNNNKALQFSGDSTGTIYINKPKGSNNNSTSSNSIASLEEWIASPLCIPSILGKGDLTIMSDDSTTTDLIENRQPKVQFFGLDIIPIYYHSITRPTSNEIKVDIAKTKTIVEGKSRVNQAAANIMEQSQFEGSSHVSIVEDEHGWTVTFDISFGVTVPLPSYFWVPPGFNSLWRGVIGGACQKKAQSLLEGLKESYEEWAKEQIESSTKSYNDVTIQPTSSVKGRNWMRPAAPIVVGGMVKTSA